MNGTIARRPGGERPLVPGVRAVDERVAGVVERIASAIEPDPLFSRRLRGEVLNRFVAAREAPSSPPASPGRRRMGRLGRGVLNASVVLALGVSAVGAAAQDALPGVPLYDIKLRLEEIRLQIAPPSVRPVLVQMALDERLEELSALAANGSWSRVPAAAERVAQASAALAAELPGTPSGEVAALGEVEAVLERVWAAAPEAARPGLERAFDGGGRADRPPNANTPQEPTRGAPGAAPSNQQPPAPGAGPARTERPAPAAASGDGEKQENEERGRPDEASFSPEPASSAQPSNPAD
jgi:hypothetical protein